MKRLTQLLAAATLTVVVSCKAPTPEPGPEPEYGVSYVRPPVAEKVEETRRHTAEAEETAAAISERTAVLKEAAKEAEKAARSAREEVQRLVAQQGANEVELKDLLRKVTEVENRNSILNVTVDELRASNAKLKEQFKLLSATNDELNSAAIKADEGSAEQKKVIESLQAQVGRLTKKNEELAAAAAKAEVSDAKASGKGNTYKWMFWIENLIIALGIIIVLIARALIKSNSISAVTGN